MVTTTCRRRREAVRRAGSRCPNVLSWSERTRRLARADARLLSGGKATRRSRCKFAVSKEEHMAKHWLRGIVLAVSIVLVGMLVVAVQGTLALAGTTGSLTGTVVLTD